MSTSDQLISRQLRREMQSHEEARLRFQNSTREAEDRSYASSTLYGRKAINGLLEPVAERMKERLFTLRRGTGAVDAVEVYKHLNEADPYSMALITMKVVLDVLGKNPEPGLQELTTKIGAAIQLELRMIYYSQQEPELYKKTEFFFHKSAGTRQKATVFKRAFNKEEIEWDRWSPTINHKVGAWLIVCLAETTGWLQRKTVLNGKKSKRVIKYTREFLEQRDTIIAAAESLAFCQWPMLCPPVDWANDQSGGYLTESVRQSNPLIRKASKVAPPKQGDIPLAMLNNLQQQAYKVNGLVFAIAEHFYEKKISVGKFKCEAPMPLPENILPDDAPDEDVSAYKRARTTAENYNSMLPQKNWRTTEVLYVARKYVAEERFWNPASFDYRGRLYFQNSALNPQGTDFDKSLLLFADEGPVNEYHLAFHVATTFGLDKETMATRVEWTRANLSLIKRVAADPLQNHEWREADEPWCFLAACLEYAACCIDCTKHTSGLPIGIDATCSGLQHLSALTRSDEGELVNVTPTDKPADGYRTVAEKAKEYLPEKYHEWINRKVTKRSVMCTPYGVTQNSARNYIRLALKEEKREFESTDLTTITNAIFRVAIPEIFPGAIEVMKWLQGSALEIMDRGEETIQWTTPSGFVVTQDLRHCNTVRVETRLMGGARVKSIIGDGYAGPDRAHHRSALAPNVVHSADAALLHLTFVYWDKPFTVIHDCVLGRSCDMDQMASDIRMHFAEMYKADVLEDWANEVGVQVPDGLIKNTLDINSVNDSLYFFC